jgi:hypothetical protein
MTNGQGLLQQVFGSLATFAQQHLAEHRQRQERLTALREAIEQAVDASEPRIRLVGNYAEKLVDAVETALNYSGSVLQHLPRRCCWVLAPGLGTRRSTPFSRRVDDVRATLGEIRRFTLFSRTSGHAECFALMLMVKRETETFGAVLSGDVWCAMSGKSWSAFRSIGYFSRRRAKPSCVKS